MDKASMAIRRGSIRLKSFSSGNPDLNMVISQLKNVRSSAKAFTAAQNIAASDLLKWSSKDPSRIIQDVFLQISELNTLWAEVQKEFTDRLKEFNRHFESILESQRHVDNAKNKLAICERRQATVKKDFQKALKKPTFPEITQLKETLSQTERATELAQTEVVERVQENETVKFNNVKLGLIKLSESFIEMSHKCNIIYDAHKEIAYDLPDVTDNNLEEIRYRGTPNQIVTTAKRKILEYRPDTYKLLPVPTAPSGPPPPYSQISHPTRFLYSSLSPDQDLHQRQEESFNISF